MINKKCKNLIMILIAVAFIKTDMHAEHYSIDTSKYVDGNDIVSEFDFEYIKDYAIWSGYFDQLVKYLDPGYTDIWNEVEEIDFYYVYKKQLGGVDGLANPGTTIKGTFGYYGVLHNANPWEWYTPNVYKFKNLTEKLKRSEDKLRIKRIISKIVKKPISIIIDNINIVFNYVRKNINGMIHKPEIMEFGFDKFGHPLSWVVIDKNIEKQEYLLLLRNQYGGIYEDENDKITWAQSHAREFLNGEFYEKRFSDDDKKRISTVEFYDEQLNENISDKVFILSYDEVKKYLYKCNSKICNLDCFTMDFIYGDDKIVEYSYNNELCKRHTRDIFTLRDYGYRKKTFSSIDIDGNIYPLETYIRPAIWVKIK